MRKQYLCCHCGIPVPYRRRSCSSACTVALQGAGRLKPGAGLSGSAARIGPHPCPRCSVLVPGGASCRLCPDCKAERTRYHNRKKNVTRRGAAVVGSLSVDEIAARDGWRCHLCWKPIRAALKSPHPLSATVDHLVPISDGGDDAPENTRLAHRVCNTRRGTGGSVQLLLVG